MMMMGQGVYEQYGVSDLEHNLRHVPSQRKGQTVAQKERVSFGVTKSGLGVRKQ